MAGKLCVCSEKYVLQWSTDDLLGFNWWLCYCTIKRSDFNRWFN